MTSSGSMPGFIDKCLNHLTITKTNDPMGDFLNAGIVGNERRGRAVLFIHIDDRS